MNNKLAMNEILNTTFSEIFPIFPNFTPKVQAEEVIPEF